MRCHKKRIEWDRVLNQFRCGKNLPEPAGPPTMPAWQVGRCQSGSNPSFAVVGEMPMHQARREERIAEGTVVISSLRTLSLLLDHATGHARSGVSRGLRFEIIGLGMHHDGVANDRIDALQSDPTICKGKASNARLVRRDVSQIPEVPLTASPPPVRHAGRIKMAAGRTGIGCRTIAFLVDMEPMLPWGESADFPLHPDALVFFAEKDFAPRCVSFRRIQPRDGICSPARGSGRRKA